MAYLNNNIKLRVGILFFKLLNNYTSHYNLTLMKKILSIFLLFSVTISFAQAKYLTKTGVISFEASVPSFEEVAAKNSNVTAIINTENGEFAALALVKGFRFKNALMEEHFNENYAESSKYPKATFKGVLKDFDFSSLQASYIVNGELEFHGVTKSIDNIKVSISQENATITMSGSFKTSPADFNIEIPSIVKEKIAENVEVSFNFSMQPK